MEGLRHGFAFLKNFCESCTCDEKGNRERLKKGISMPIVGNIGTTREDVLAD